MTEVRDTRVMEDDNYQPLHLLWLNQYISGLWMPSSHSRRLRKTNDESAVSEYYQRDRDQSPAVVLHTISVSIIHL